MSALVVIIRLRGLRGGYRRGDPQARRGGAGEADGSHGEDRRGHRRHPALRHHLPRGGAPDEEKV